MNREIIQQLLQEYIANQGLSTDGPTALFVRQNGQGFTLLITGSQNEMEVIVSETKERYQYDIREFS